MPDMPRTWTINDAEFEAVTSLPRERRFEHFLSRAADWEWAWGLEGDSGTVVQSADDGIQHVALWPHSRYAEACATGAWSGSLPAAFEVHDLVTSRLPKMAKDGMMVVVFPTPEDSGFVVTPAGLGEALGAALAEYE